VALCESLKGPAASKNLRMVEILSTGAVSSPDFLRGRVALWTVGEANRRNPHMYDSEMSDGPIVPEKRSNKLCCGVRRKWREGAHSWRT
jgi:hypothetical protein